MSPDGANLVYVANERLYLRPLSGLEFHEIPGSVGAISPAFSPDGQSVAFDHVSDQALKSLPIAGGTPQKVCEAPQVESLSWDGSGLVYSGGGPGGAIWRVPATGGAPAAIVEAGADEVVGMPQLLPGGQAVLFSVREIAAGHDEGTIAVQPLDGGPRTTLLTGGWDGRYLPTGHLVYAVEGVLRAVPFDLGSLSVTGEPVSPPDGRFVTFDTDVGREANVWFYALDGKSQIRQLTFGGRNQYPIWSADGQFVAFQSDRERDRAIFRLRADGSSSPERLTTADAGAEHVPQAFSPDGAYLLYSVRQGGEWTLWTRATKEQTSTMFGDIHSAFQIDAAFSPDGRWVAYHERERNGTQSVQTFLQPFPAVPGVKHWVASGGGQPYWSPKGDQLIVNTNPGLSSIFPITTSPAVTVGQPIDFTQKGRMEANPSIARRNVDSLPDGTHIIGVANLTPAATGGRRITVVLNWFEDVKQRVR